MVHTPEVGDAKVSLLAVAQVRLGDEDVAHGEHTQTSNLLGAVEDDRWEPTGHLTVQPNLDTLQPSKAGQCPLHYMQQYCQKPIKTALKAVENRS